MRALSPAVCQSPLAAILCCSAFASAQRREPEWNAARAAATFQKSCASCHVIPDAAVRTDRAWIDQVNRTT